MNNMTDTGMIDRIGNEMIVASLVLHTNSVDRIAGELQYNPVLVINALYRAEDQGKVKYDSKTKTFSIYEEVDVPNLAITENFLGHEEDIDVNEQIAQLIRNLNQDETDMSVEELVSWIPGSAPIKFKVFAYVHPELATYELTDPKDSKSVYTFVTLKENLGKNWGAKQFKAKSLVKQHIDATTGSLPPKKGK
jgi:hypothetical protein